MGEHKLLYLTESDVVATEVTMAEIIETVEAAFREHGEGRTEMPPKPGVHSRPGAFIHAMPAYLPGIPAIGMKWVAGYPGNRRRGLPQITGLLILNDKETGLPVAVMGCAWITAKRTGAATAVAARHLARPDAKALGILGCGVQGRGNLEALRELYALTRVVAYDIAAEQLDGFCAHAKECWDIDVVRASHPREAVEGCDIVVTAGQGRPRHNTIKRGWLSEGSFASLVDIDAYWDGSALKDIDKFVTDEISQMDHYRALGHFADFPPVYATLGELAAGKKPGREGAQERTMACNIGVAFADMALAPVIYRRAVERSIGTRLPV